MNCKSCILGISKEIISISYKESAEKNTIIANTWYRFCLYKGNRQWYLILENRANFSQEDLIFFAEFFWSNLLKMLIAQLDKKF